MMKFIWIYLVLVISSFSYGEEIISASYLVSVIENQANNEENPIEFYIYEPSESGISAIIWLNDEEDFSHNQEDIRVPHDLLDIPINLPIVNENTDINTMKEFYENEQNNYDIASPFGGGGGGGGEFTFDQQPLENNIFLDEDIKNAIVSTFGGGGGFVLAQEILKKNTNDFLEEDVTDEIVSTFGGGGYKRLFFQNLSEDEINNLFNELNGDQNTLDNFFKYDPSKDRTNERKNFPQDIVGTLGGGGVVLASQYSPGEYADNFSNVFILVRRKNLQEHFDAGYFPQSSLSFTGSDPISRGFIDGNGTFPAQLNTRGIRFQ